MNLEPAAAQTPPFYQGKTLKIIVGSASGGGYDLWARLLALHIGKHIPGHPTVIVQNLPGAGGLVAGNFIYGLAKPDGLTIGAFNPALYFEQLVGKPESKFDWTKFSWIGSPEKNDALHYIRADSPYKTIDDLRNAKEPPKCGSTGGGTTAHYFPRLLEDTLGIKTTQVTGYQGGSEIDLAVERNEIICWTPLIATYFGREPYKRWHKTGFVRVVVQTGDKRDERLKDVPTLTELMQQYKTPEASRRLAKVVLTAANLGRPIGGPPRLPAELTKNSPRRLRQDDERSRAPRRSRQARLGSRPAHRRRTRSAGEGSHQPAQGSDRADEVGARELDNAKAFQEFKVQAFNRILSDSLSDP